MIQRPVFGAPCSTLHASPPLLAARPDADFIFPPHAPLLAQRTPLILCLQYPPRYPAFLPNPTHCPRLPACLTYTHAHTHTHYTTHTSPPHTPPPAASFWARKATVLSCVSNALMLVLYWSAGYITIMQHVHVSPPRAFVATIMCVIGTALMLAADTQKYFVLKLRKGLIDDGWFARCRNTNYLGEIILYASFGVVAQHWLPWSVMGFMWSFVFLGRWIAKEASFRRKKGGPEYMSRSGLIFPWLGGAGGGGKEGAKKE